MPLVWSVVIFDITLLHVKHVQNFASVLIWHLQNFQHPFNSFGKVNPRFFADVKCYGGTF